MKRFMRPVFFRMPRLGFAYRFCSRYVAYYEGNNGYDMRVNGEFNFLRGVIIARPRATVFDVGANVGEWSKEALRVSSTISLHCFEPHPQAYNTLRESGFSPSVTLNCMALGQVAGVESLFLYESGLFNSLYPWPDRPFVSSIEVEVSTVTDYCKKNGIQQIDLMKIDVEGGEFQVLLGARTMLEEGRIAYVQFEYGPNYIGSRTLLKDIFDLAEKIDYEVFKILPRSLLHEPHYRTDLENFRPSYYALVHVSALAELSYRLRIVHA